MADAKDEKKDDKKAAAAGKKSGGKKGIILFMIIFGISFWFVFPTLVLFLVGMFPTFIALLTDTDRQRTSSAAVGAMNAAGVTPFVIDLWTKGQTMENVFQILREPSSWLIMLGAAGVGQLIAFAVPQMVASLTLTQDEARLKILRANLESLKEVWGPEVGTTKPMNKLGTLE
jgi:hypothetical protein